MRVRAGSATDIGRAREHNEDAYLAEEPLFAVADGMGGHRGGDVASNMAVETLRHAQGAGHRSWPQLLEKFREANRRVLERGGQDIELRGMGTTLTAVHLSGSEARIAHVGDSRAYLLRDGALHLLTEDHTLVQRMVREGRLSREGARHHPQRSILTRALGVEEDMPIDEVTLPLRDGDRMLLCTDGLTGMLSEDSIRDILLGEPEGQDACKKLIDEANRAGGDDNITAIVLDLDTEAEEPSSSSERTVAHEAPRAAPSREGPKPVGQFSSIRWSRASLWAGGLAATLLIAFIGLRVYANHQWYVGTADGQVAIYNGIPTKVAGLSLSHVEEVTELPAYRAERLLPWKGLEGGITARSFEEAQAIVAQIRSDLALLSSGVEPASGGG